MKFLRKWKERLISPIDLRIRDEAISKTTKNLNN